MNKCSKLKNAILYASSLYKGAIECSKLDETYQNAERLLQSTAQGFKDLNMLNNPIWPAKEKEKLIEAVVQELKLNAPMLNLLKILVENRKIDELELILNQFKKIYNDKQNIAEVDVDTVVELSSQQDENLKQKLTSIFKKKIIINYHINPQILGGLIIRCGTVQIDSSVKHQLDSLEQLMKGTK